jgi:hypothetical protein
MLSRWAITKLQVILIIDLLVVAVAAGGYFYFQSLPPQLKPAEFQVADLIISPAEAGVGQSIRISANVTNVGEEEGNYSMSLRVNDVVRETKTVQLLGNESRVLEFSVTENREGNYHIKIEDLNGTFVIVAEPPPDVFKISDLTIRPYENWVNEPVTISANVTNLGDRTYSYSLAFRVNEVVRETKTIQLSAGETMAVNSTVTETSEGAYSVIVGGLTGKFYVVPTGKHTLRVVTVYTGLNFNIDGRPCTTPYSELLDVGPHTLLAPDTFTTHMGGLFQFVEWSDGYPDARRPIDLLGWVILQPTYKLISGIASCPSLYIWNGINYVYCTEVSSGTGYLGILDYFGENWTMVFAYSYPWDYLKLDNSQLQPRNGLYYDMKLTQLWDEIFYLDSARLLVVDHSPDVDVFSTKGTYIYNLDGQGEIYTVSKNPLTPISCVNDEGEDCLPQISKLDGIYTTAHEFQYDNFTLNLGDLSNAKEIKLIVAGETVYSSGEDQGEWAANFATQPGVKPFPPPYMEVKDIDGNWVPVPDSRQFPLLDVTPNRFVVNLTGLFPTNDYSLRIHNFFNAPFDYIGIDTTPQQYVIIREIYPFNAALTRAFSTSSTSTGNFTKYGEVTQLMLEADDRFVIGRQGDEVSLKFNADLESVPEGVERDYFFVVSCWFKVDELPYLGFTVDPLPFHDMNCFPYPPTESYPYDRDHLSYLLEYNTRAITNP